jgi:hypothetical protein
MINEHFLQSINKLIKGLDKEGNYKLKFQILDKLIIPKYQKQLPLY